MTEKGGKNQRAWLWRCKLAGLRSVFLWKKAKLLVSVYELPGRACPWEKSVALKRLSWWGEGPGQEGWLAREAIHVSSG